LKSNTPKTEYVVLDVSSAFKIIKSFKRVSSPIRNISSPEWRVDGIENYRRAHTSGLIIYTEHLKTDSSSVYSPDNTFTFIMSL
jgi:hypothetical protein